MPDAPAPLAVRPTESPGWYRDIPQWARAVLQLGFAGLIALLFALDSRDRTHQIQEFQADSRQQAREDRQMFREESRTNREMIQAQQQQIHSLVAEMRRAIDRLDDSQRTIKQDVRDLKFGGPDSFKAPPPREKPE